MIKYLFIAATAIVALASCSDESFVGDNSPNELNGQDGTQAIVFNSGTNGITRSDIMGPAAADLLGGNFYVTGTKGTEEEAYPTGDIVFDNYLVNYTTNTAGKTTSNTANWEYVGVTPDGTNHVKLSSLNSQTIKYWDYSTSQYDFFAFSTGTNKAISSTNPSAGEIGVTAMKYGENLENNGVAYTFHIPDANAIKQTYITDITEVKKANYGKEVTLKFKNLGSKVRVALYETVPGYSVQAASVKFYTVDGTTSFSNAKGTSAALISGYINSFASKGKIEVYFPNIGTNNESNDNYNKAAAIVTPSAGDTKMTFGNLATDKYAVAEGFETGGSLYLGRDFPNATYAGDVKAAYYETVFPVSTSHPLTLRVDYTLVSTDGSGETINVYGAKAIVPATYTKWQPNYAYTYIFKISNNTNGWTDPNATLTSPAGLFPITFDALVTEATDFTDEQATITTVSTPTITTYQQNHDITKDEYSKATGKNIYVQVMHNYTNSPHLVGFETDCGYPKLSNNNSLLYAVSKNEATEAEVMDALEKRTTAIDADDVTGRNGITLTKNSNIDATVTSIVNGVDDNPITVATGAAAEIKIANLTPGTYAYVYDYISSKGTVTEYQPITVTTGSAIGASGKQYASITTTTLESITTVTTANEAVNNSYIYFSKTKNGGSTTTYSYISVTGKKKLPAGLIKVNKSSLTTNVDGDTAAVEGTFYFDVYITNNGEYAVKIIKIVA